MAIQKNRDDNNYWISYTDLMTGFLIIFIILTIIVYVNSENRIRTIKDMYQNCDSTVTSLSDTINKLQGIIGDISIELEEYKKLEEIKNSIKYIDPNLFKFNEKYKKHILNLDVQFVKESANIHDISKRKINELVKAGNKIITLIRDSLPKNQNIKYLIIIEGQASKDSYPHNDVLSYKRALSLKQLWIDKGIDFGKLKNCELVIAGSGVGGVPRVEPDNSPKNQRFLIQIIPKVGEINRDLIN